ncbi:MAG: response regulator [Gorillibacterium sp.]|nr:response regulator [Gorillibacterium sp.]
MSDSMYKVLLVDDELYALKAINSKVDWLQLDVIEVLQALNARQAKELLQQHKIDLMVCDIEMPGENGLELLEWVRENYPLTEAVFLTCHSEFEFAQQAITLGSLDYLLKPIKDYDAFTASLKKALDRVRRGREVEVLEASYENARNQWNTQQNLLFEKFWQDLFAQKQSMESESLNRSLKLNGIPLTNTSRIVIIMLSLEEWKEEFTERDEKILEYGIRNVATELILAGRPGMAIQDNNGLNMVLCYLEEDTSLDREELRNNCLKFLEAAEAYLYCHLSCYIGTEAPLSEVLQIYYKLQEIEHHTINDSRMVMFQEDVKELPHVLRLPIPELSGFQVLFETGDKQQLLERIHQYFLKPKFGVITSELLESIYHYYLQLLSTSIYKEGLVLTDVFTTKELRPVDSWRNLQQVAEWTTRVVSTGIEYRNSHSSKSSSSAIEKIKKYIEDHITKPLSREEIAAHVFLNAAYVSRLFKKETGKSLSEYIMYEKMERAKHMLTSSNLKISSIAEELGYVFLSHFTKIFKKVVGISPMDYRKKYQN